MLYFVGSPIFVQLLLKFFLDPPLLMTNCHQFDRHSPQSASISFWFPFALFKYNQNLVAAELPHNSKQQLMSSNYPIR